MKRLNVILLGVAVLSILLFTTCEKENQENKPKPGDKIEIDDFEKLNNYSVQGNKWNSCNITYYIVNYSNDLSV